MRFTSNPFEEVYISEMVSTDDFVELFSPMLVEQKSLFGKLNVVVRGTEGAGKTMLLNLFKPETRLAYARLDRQFPADPEFRRFVGAGISLKRSAALDFALRPDRGEDEEVAMRMAMRFGDFVNCWLVRDLFDSVTLLGEYGDSTLSGEIGLAFSPKDLDVAAQTLASSPSWGDLLLDVGTAAELHDSLTCRIEHYRRYLNYSVEDLPAGTLTAIGEPVGAAANALRQSQVLAEDTAVYVRIDEYDLLSRLEGPSAAGDYMRRMINKAMWLRDQRIRYRIGTRPYGWGDTLVIKTKDRLARKREYDILDIDEHLLRRERGADWVFPSFAEDVLRRRLRGDPESRFSREDGRLLSQLFGPSPTPEEIALKYCGKTSTTQGLRLDKRSPSGAYVPDEWRTALRELAKEDPLSAKLGEAWLRQRSKRKEEIQGPTTRSPAPWAGHDAKSAYWRKDRKQIAAMQIASVCRQRMLWWGERDIVALSGNNITTLLSVCQNIWDAWQRVHPRGESIDEGPAAMVDTISQDSGIYATSNYWHDEKIVESPEGHDLRAFLDSVAAALRARLVQDLDMTYPGHNGFSVATNELNDRTNRDVANFLGLAVSYGHLVCRKHSTKAADRRGRTKYYLRPILCPYYRLPVGMLQEPLYVSCSDIRRWIGSATGPQAASSGTKRAQLPPAAHQLGLFDGE